MRANPKAKQAVASVERTEISGVIPVQDLFWRPVIQCGLLHEQEYRPAGNYGGVAQRIVSTDGKLLYVIQAFDEIEKWGKMLLFMRYLVVLFLFIVPVFAAEQPSCLIVKRASTSRQIFVSGANWEYVAGKFPKSMRGKSNITDGYIRKIKAAGGKVVIVPQQYSVPDLEHAKTECEEQVKQNDSGGL